MKNTEQGLTAVIADYITARSADKLEKLDKDINKLKASANPADQVRLETMEQKRRDEVSKFIPANWLSDAAKRAGQLQLVTHAPKFIHSDARASGVYAPATPADRAMAADGTVSSSSIGQPQIDVIGNAAALDVGKLLQLSSKSSSKESDKGKALIDYIAADDLTPLLPLAQDEAQARSWLNGFKQAISADKVSSHQLAKQVYWPIDNAAGGETQYHLLAPLFATSLQQQLYQTITGSRFSDTAKQAREARKAGKPHDIGIVNFGGIAEQHFGGTKPQNISQLNSQRYGKGLLLSAAPPQWQTMSKPPLTASTIFGGIFNHRAAKPAASLRRYLEQVYERGSVKAIRDERAAQFDHIIDLLFGYVAEVHQFAPGWSASADCNLPLAEQLLLDPQRRESDPLFAAEWDKKEWPAVIAASFARWLNRQIEGGKRKSDKLVPGQVEFVEWRDLLAQKLRILKDDFNDFYMSDDQQELSQ